MAGPRILLIVGGGIAAYKSCELVRLIRRGGGSVTVTGKNIDGAIFSDVNFGAGGFSDFTDDFAA